MVLNIALNYGGRNENSKGAIQKIVRKGYLQEKINRKSCDELFGYKRIA